MIQLHSCDVVIILKYRLGIECSDAPHAEPRTRPHPPAAACGARACCVACAILCGVGRDKTCVVCVLWCVGCSASSSVKRRVAHVTLVVRKEYKFLVLFLGRCRNSKASGSASRRLWFFRGPSLLLSKIPGLCYFRTENVNVCFRCVRGSLLLKPILCSHSPEEAEVDILSVQ